MYATFYLTQDCVNWRKNPTSLLHVKGLRNLSIWRGVKILLSWVLAGRRLVVVWEASGMGLHWRIICPIHQSLLRWGDAVKSQVSMLLVRKWKRRSRVNRCVEVWNKDFHPCNLVHLQKISSTPVEGCTRVSPSPINISVSIVGSTNHWNSKV